MSTYKFNPRDCDKIVHGTSSAFVPGSNADHRTPSLVSQSTTFDAKSAPVIDAALAALDQHKRREMDPHHFGHGVWIDGKWRPRRANPKQRPPLQLERYLDQDGDLNVRRQYLMAGKSQHKKHVKGGRPLFDLNCANRVKRKWDLSKLPALIERCLPDYRGEHLAAKIEDVVKYLSDDDARGCGDTVTLSPDSALKLLRSTPITSQELHLGIQDHDHFKDVRRALIDLHKDDDRTTFFAVKRAIEQSVTHYLVPTLTHEMVVDIDRVDGQFTEAEQVQASKTLADNIVADIFAPVAWPVFIEVSRNRKGMYIRFRIARKSSPSDFNDTIGKFQWYLRDKYNREGKAAKVDKVGGRLLYYFENPQFDLHSYNKLRSHSRLTNGEWYRWAKTRHGLDTDSSALVLWDYRTERERFEFKGGDLITKPLHNIVADDDGGKARVERYEHFRGTDAPPESLLHSLIPCETAGDTEVEADEEDDKENTLKKVNRSAFAGRGKKRTKQAEKRRDQEIFADPKSDSQSRYNAGARIVLRQIKPTDGTDPELFNSLVEAVLQKVESQGGPTDQPRHPERIKRVQEIVSYWMDTFDITKTSKRRAKSTIDLPDPAINPVPFNELHRLIQDRVPEALLQEAKRDHRAHINHNKLTVAFAGYLVGIHTGRLTQVSQDFIVSYCRHRGLALGKNDQAAVRWILTHESVRLLVQTAKHVGPGGGWQGRCASFTLHPECPVPPWVSDHVKPIITGI